MILTNRSFLKNKKRKIISIFFRFFCPRLLAKGSRTGVLKLFIFLLRLKELSCSQPAAPASGGFDSPPGILNKLKPPLVAEVLVCFAVPKGVSQSLGGKPPRSFVRGCRQTLLFVASGVARLFAPPSVGAHSSLATSSTLPRGPTNKKD